MKTNFIRTKYGTFGIEQSNNGTSLFVGETKVIEFPKVNWWDTDTILSKVEKNKDLIVKRVGEAANNATPKVERENVETILKDVLDVLGKEDEKGFYKSRIKSVINKLK